MRQPLLRPCRVYAPLFHIASVTALGLQAVLKKHKAAVGMEEGLPSSDIFVRTSRLRPPRAFIAGFWGRRLCILLAFAACLPAWHLPAVLPPPSIPLPSCQQPLRLPLHVSACSAALTRCCWRLVWRHGISGCYLLRPDDIPAELLPLFAVVADGFR